MIVVDSAAVVDALNAIEGTGELRAYLPSEDLHAPSLLDAGYRAIVMCVDTDRLDRSFCGRALDAAILAELPAGTDPAGENGEFHTFVAAGPAFTVPIAVTRAAVYEQGRFRYQELLPG